MTLSCEKKFQMMISFSISFKFPIKEYDYLDEIYEIVYDIFILENKIETLKFLLFGLCLIE